MRVQRGRAVNSVRAAGVPRHAEKPTATLAGAPLAPTARAAPVAAEVVTLRDSAVWDAPFANVLMRRVMDHYVRQTWTSPEDVETYFRKNQFDPATTRIICWRDVAVGWLSLRWSADEVFVDHVHIHPAFQGRGIGSVVLRRVLAEARARGLATRLQVLRVNPAARLYMRLGFRVHAETVTHFSMEVPAPAASATGNGCRPGTGDAGPRELAAQYPDVPLFVILKMDVQRRGLRMTTAALDAVQGPEYNYGRSYVLYGQGEAAPRYAPGPLLLRDGTSVLALADAGGRNPYTVDRIDDRFVLFDGDAYVDDVDFTSRPAYYGKRTRRGVPMESIASARPQRLDINPYRFCHFWEGGNQCKYCAYFTDVKAQERCADGRVAREVDLEDVYDTVREALQEPGRFSQVMLTSGADYRGERTFDFEVDRHIATLQAIGRNFRTRRFASQLIGCAYDQTQLRRLHAETGLTAYCPDIEVWDARLFEWICPGKAKWPGRDGWIRSALDAVDIFGPGNVYTNAVAGVELARPHGFATEDEALASHVEGCEFFARHGIVYLSLVWIPWRGSQFANQAQPSLRFYVRLIRELRAIRKAHGLLARNDDYRHCGNHGDSDLERLEVAA